MHLLNAKGNEMTDKQIKEEIKHINTRNQEYIAENNKMTKKIIDGVDVAKCRNFTSEWDFNNCGHICKGTECKYKRLWYKKQLKRKEQECEELRRSITKIFTCLIKANNRGKIIDTLWVDRITTLWDYIALTLGIEGDQTQIEEQILQKIS